MKIPFEYRSYLIDTDDGWFIAKSLDDEPCEIGSRQLVRVMRAIDMLWDALEDNAVPQWLTPSGSINLDQQVIDSRTIFETAPSEVDPPSWKTVLMILAAIGFAMPVALLANKYVAGLEPEIIFTLIVMAIALAFGTPQAITASFIFATAFNYFFQPQPWQFESPGVVELIYLMINLGLSVALPWLFGPRSQRAGKSASDRTRRTA